MTGPYAECLSCGAVWTGGDAPHTALECVQFRMAANVAITLLNATRLEVTS